MPVIEAPVPETVIEARDLWRRFGSLEAVRGVNLRIRRGEVFGFLGPNGAGKSTLMRMLVGLLEPSAGELNVLGCALPAQAERLRQRLGYMTQKFSLYEDLSIEENLQFAAEIFGLDGSRLQPRVDEVLEEHGLDARRRERPATLSGGWRQRLALAAATIHRPELLLLDEPTAGVDPDRRRDFWQKLFDLASEGATVLVSTHYMDEAVRCHRLCMLRRGRRVALGRPQELAEELADRIVEVEVDAPESVAEILEQRPQILCVTQLGNELHLMLSADAPPAAEIARQVVSALDAAGFDHVRAEPAEPTLEDVFVALNLGEHLGEPEECEPEKCETEASETEQAETLEGEPCA